jgi:hypothetical protein
MLSVVILIVVMEGVVIGNVAMLSVVFYLLLY